MHLLLGDRHMLNHAGNHGELTRTEFDIAVAQSDDKVAVDHVEELVLGFVMMPDELTLEFNSLDPEVIDLTNYPGRPVVSNETKLIRDTHFLNQFDPSISNTAVRAILASRGCAIAR